MRRWHIRVSIGSGPWHDLTMSAMVWGGRTLAAADSVPRCRIRAPISSTSGSVLALAARLSPGWVGGRACLATFTGSGAGGLLLSGAAAASGCACIAFVDGSKGSGAGADSSMASGDVLLARTFSGGGCSCSRANGSADAAVGTSRGLCCAVLSGGCTTGGSRGDLGGWAVAAVSCPVGGDGVKTVSWKDQATKSAPRVAMGNARCQTRRRTGGRTATDALFPTTASRMLWFWGDATGLRRLGRGAPLVGSLALDSPTGSTPWFVCVGQTIDLIILAY